METVLQLPYLEAAIRESLRLNPSTAVNSRVAVRDTMLYDGTFIKKGTTAFLSGPRACIGMSFALMEMEIAMAAVLSKFDEKDPFECTHHATVTLTIRGLEDVTATPLAVKG
ncbi:Cytochrome p450 [Globisporangium polare]